MQCARYPFSTIVYKLHDSTTSDTTNLSPPDRLYIMSQTTLKHMPPCKWPHSVPTYVCLSLMILQAVVCFVPEKYYPHPFHALLTFLRHRVLRALGSHVALRWFVPFTFLLHFFETMCALIFINRFHKRHLKGIHTIRWTLQTILLGYPSLKQLFHDLEHSSEKAADHRE